MISDSDLDFEDTPPASPPARPQRNVDVPPDAEHYEGAELAVVPPRHFQSASEPRRTLPHSLEAEEYLISSCILDGADVIGKCLRARISPDSFFDPKHGILFEILLDLYHRNAKVIEPSVVAEELKTRKQLEQVGGFAFIAQVSGRVPTTAHASYFIEKVREQALLRMTIREATAAVEDAYGFSGDIDGFAARFSSRLARVSNAVRKEIEIDVKPITSFEYPTTDDPNILLGSDDYLGRGGGMLFVSHAGAGKSSFIMDACMSWAIGEPWVSVKCNGPLKSLIVQAEDSWRYVGKVAASFAHMRKLSTEQRALLAKNCVVAKVKGITGDAFFAEVERLIEIHQPDLVVINPIYIYAEGDISKSECAQPFLAHLDRINRPERFGWILVHHTGKPQQKSPTGKRAELDDWETIYMGFGSSYLANWPRCSALLEPRSGEKGRYVVKLGKAGANAGATRKLAVQGGMSFRYEPTTRISIRHCTATIDINGVERPAIYWERDEEDGPALAPEREGGSGGEDRKERSNRCKYSINDFRPVFAIHCPNESKRTNYNVLYRAAHGVLGIGKSAFNSIIQEAISEGVLVRHPADNLYHIPTP